MFQRSLDKHIFAVLQRHMNGKNCLIFCPTRKATVEAAKQVLSDSKASGSNMFIQGREQQEMLDKASYNIKDMELRQLIKSGVAVHHAGLDRNDRNIVEKAFTQRHLLILFATSTLSMGINLPARTVIIKGTFTYNQNGFAELTPGEVQQMLGRAGKKGNLFAFVLLRSLSFRAM
jgi:ATP-dependent DNA helicase HFM1/MER3